MGLGGCYSCIKYLMFAFNFLFWLMGCALLGAGIWVLVDPNIKKFLDNADLFQHLYTGAYILIGVGVLIMIIGFLGCCGAIKESQCMLAMFFVFLSIIFVVLLAVGIWFIVANADLQDKVRVALTESAKKYEKQKLAEIFMDNVQTTFECCGSARGTMDYTEHGVGIPKSCENNGQVPCDDKLFSHLRANTILVAAIYIGIGSVMVLGMVLSMMLCCTIREAAA